MTKESAWQEKITGEWYGCPSVFDMQGEHKGYDKVSRSSVYKDGVTTYYMDTKLEATGKLRSRFEAQNFAFGVKDGDKDRVYLGPDFYGAGHPYGMLVDAHYYSPGWSADLRTMVHILADGKTQVYSSQLFEGPRLISVFNGLYLMASDYETNMETKEKIDAFIESERKNGLKPHVLPMKQKGLYRGEFQVYDSEQNFVGKNYVKIDYTPKDLKSAMVELFMEGVLNERFSYTRLREGERHDFCGPDLYGNGFAYGRALYTSLHVASEARKIKGRDFIIDDKNSQSCVWQIYKSDKLVYTMYGVLEFESLGEVLKPQY